MLQGYFKNATSSYNIECTPSFYYIFEMILGLHSDYFHLFLREKECVTKVRAGIVVSYFILSDGLSNHNGGL